MLITVSLVSKLTANVARKLIKFQFGVGPKQFSYVKMSNADEKYGKIKLAPPLTGERHKGQDGRIGVFGGSIEYTGAPYFAAISALKVGADLSYVFCNKEAAPVIKSYSPELIVLPYLDHPEAVDQIESWLDRLHVVLIGPGLGRHQNTFDVIEGVVKCCRERKLPMIIDADGLFLVTQKPDIIKNYPAPVILTPNAIEFNRLVGNDGDGTKFERARTFLANASGNVTLLCKGQSDEIVTKCGYSVVSGGGSGRRCGGQGDILGGALSTFLAWASLSKDEVNVACYSACRLTRNCNAKAFARFGRSMTATDMIEEIHNVFEDKFEV